MSRCSEIDEDTVWSPAKADVYVIDFLCSIAEDVKLTILPGTLIKVRSGGIQVRPGAALEAHGTSEDPIAFTSVCDDSLGPKTGDCDELADRFVNSSGDVSLRHVTMRESGIPIEVESEQAVSPRFTLEDSRIEGTVFLDAVNLFRPIVKRTTFALPDDHAPEVVNVPSVFTSDFAPALYLGSNVDAAGVDLTGSSTNRFEGTGSRRVVMVRGTVAAGSTWRIGKESNSVLRATHLDVDGRMELYPGTIVKGNVGIHEGGVLSAAGTADEPVLFANECDASAGGPTRDPCTSGGGGITSHGATLDLQHVHVRVTGDSTSAIAMRSNAASARLQLKDSRIEGTVSASGGPAQLVMQRNVFDLRNAGTSQRAITGDFDPSGIDLAGENRNTFLGEGLARAIFWFGGELPSGAVWEVARESRALLMGPGGPILGRVELGPGTILKGLDLSVRDGGSVKAEGTPADPVLFTSPCDQSAGGTTQEGTSCLAGNHVVAGDQSDVTLRHVTMRRAFLRAIGASSGSRVTVTDSRIESTVGLSTEALDVRRTVFALPPDERRSGPFAVALGSDPSGFDLAGKDSNVLIGDGEESAVTFGGTVPSGSTWEIDRESGALLRPVGGEVRGRLELSPAMVVKGGPLVIGDGGVLQAGRATAAPVTFTSDCDDSIGGSTAELCRDVDDTGIDLGQGDFVQVEHGGTALLPNVQVRNARRGLSVADGGYAEIRGSVTDSEVGVESPDAYVDARHVDWGDPSGPAPIGRGTPIDGPGIVVEPWRGQEPPATPPPYTPDPGFTPGARVCANFLFIGVRGSGESPQPDIGESYEDDPLFERSNMGTRINSVAAGFDAAVDLLFPGARVREIGLRYPAEDATASEFANGDFVDSYRAGVREISDLVARERARCEAEGTPERIVLSGYSQGALVIHLALGEGSINASDVAAVAQVADPALLKDQKERLIGGAAEHAQGVYVNTYQEFGISTPPFPDQLATNVTTLCKERDLVCAPGIRGGSVEVHGSYSEEELRNLGERAAADLVEVPDF